MLRNGTRNQSAQLFHSRSVIRAHNLFRYVAIFILILSNLSWLAWQIQASCGFRSSLIPLKDFIYRKHHSGWKGNFQLWKTPNLDWHICKEWWHSWDKEMGKGDLFLEIVSQKVTLSNYISRISFQIFPTGMNHLLLKLFITFFPNLKSFLYVCHVLIPANFIPAYYWFIKNSLRAEDKKMLSQSNWILTIKTTEISNYI